MTPDIERYLRAMQGVQSAIAWAMTHPDREVNKLVEPKHLRVGVDSSMISHLALAKLLIAKGLFTLQEYEEAMADAAEEELMNWENQASQAAGFSISFR